MQIWPTAKSTPGLLNIGRINKQRRDGPKTADRGPVKIIWHDGRGMSLYAKRLEKGRFIWPSPSDGVLAISASQLAYMLDGIDWRNPVRGQLDADPIVLIKMATNNISRL